MLDETALDRLIDDVIADRRASTIDDPAAEIVAGLARLNRVRPALAGKTKARHFMLIHARELQEKPAISWWRQRLTAVFAAATALTMLSGGTVYAASGSAPGDLLYPVKRAAEGISIKLKPPGLARAQGELDLARIRLAEIKILIERNDRRRVKPLVGELNGNLTAAGDRRSRLTTGQRRRIETGVVSLRRAVNLKNLPPAIVRPEPALRDRPKSGLAGQSSERGPKRRPLPPRLR